MTVTPRFEIKYLLVPSQYWSLCKALCVGFKRDRVSSEAPGGRYLVNTVYFDSWDYREYFEKISGVFQRRKLRLRTYWDDGSEASFINVEEKRREGSLITKHAARVSCEEYRTFMNTMHWPDDGNPFLKRFETMVKLEDLRPKLVVRYQREVFESRDGGGVRVALDHDVRYCAGRDLFVSEGRFRRDLGRHVIMEVKTARSYNPWVHELVRKHGLKAGPNSKYVNGINHTTQAIWF